MTTPTLTNTQQAANDTDRPVSTLHWLLVGGTGRPPSSYASLHRMAQERVAAAAAERAWKEARKQDKSGPAAATDDEDQVGPVRAGFDADSRPRNLLRWHREHKARNRRGVVSGVEDEGTVLADTGDGTQQGGEESGVGETQGDAEAAGNQADAPEENVES